MALFASSLLDACRFPTLLKKKARRKGAFFPHKLNLAGRSASCRHGCGACQDGASPWAVAGPFATSHSGMVARPYRLRWQRSRTPLRNTDLIWSGLVRSTTPRTPAKDEDQGPRTCSSRVANNLEKAVIVRLSVVEVVRRDWTAESRKFDALTWPALLASGASHSPPKEIEDVGLLLFLSRCAAPIAIITFRWGKKPTLADTCAK